jgi:hypothetical protein
MSQATKHRKVTCTEDRQCFIASVPTKIKYSNNKKNTFKTMDSQVGGGPSPNQLIPFRSLSPSTFEVDEARGRKRKPSPSSIKQIGSGKRKRVSSHSPTVAATTAVVKRKRGRPSKIQPPLADVFTLPLYNPIVASVAKRANSNVKPRAQKAVSKSSKISKSKKPVKKAKKPKTLQNKRKPGRPKSKKTTKKSSCPKRIRCKLVASKKKRKPNCTTANKRKKSRK